MQPGRLKIIGIGNPYAGDDGIGIELLHRLAGLLPASYEFHESPHPGLELLEELNDQIPIVFLDAVVDAAPLGTVHWLEWEEQSEWTKEERLPSSHGFGVLEVMRLAQSLGQKLPPIYFVGVSIKASRPSNRISAELRQQLPDIAHWSRDHILQAAQRHAAA